MAYIIAGCKAEKTFKELEITVKSTIDRWSKYEN